MKSFPVCTVLRSLLGHLDVDSEMIPQDMFVVRLSTFFTLLTTAWAIFCIDDNNYILCISTNWLLSQHTIWLFLPINFTISFSIQVVKTVILTQQTISFCVFFLSLSSLQANLLTVMVLKFPGLAEHAWKQLPTTTKP